MNQIAKTTATKQKPVEFKISGIFGRWLGRIIQPIDNKTQEKTTKIFNDYLSNKQKTIDVDELAKTIVLAANELAKGDNTQLAATTTKIVNFVLIKWIDTPLRNHVAAAISVKIESIMTENDIKTRVDKVKNDIGNIERIINSNNSLNPPENAQTLYDQWKNLEKEIQKNLKELGDRPKSDESYWASGGSNNQSEIDAWENQSDATTEKNKKLTEQKQGIERQEAFQSYVSWMRHTSKETELRDLKNQLGRLETQLSQLQQTPRPATP